MTPLAQKLQGELILKSHKRRIVVGPGIPSLPPAITSMTFFDLRKVHSILPTDRTTIDVREFYPADFAEEYAKVGDHRSTLAFAPAPECWFEVADDMALMLVRAPGEPRPARSLYRERPGEPSLSPHLVDANVRRYVFTVVAQRDDVLTMDLLGVVLMREDCAGFQMIGAAETRGVLARKMGAADAEKMLDSFGALLALSLVAINSSRYAVSNVIVPGERDRQRSLRGKSLVGKFPLRAYSEIVLRPGETIIPEPQTCATTGERAQHFVRSHLRRYRSGKTVLVKEHHRGNPALGMIQHRYRIEKP